MKTTGKKKEDVLLQLIAAIQNKNPITSTAEIDNYDLCMMGLPPTAYWKELTKCDAPIPEPQNDDRSLLSPI